MQSQELSSIVRDGQVWSGIVRQKGAAHRNNRQMLRCAAPIKLKIKPSEKNKENLAIIFG